MNQSVKLAGLGFLLIAAGGFLAFSGSKKNEEVAPATVTSPSSVTASQPPPTAQPPAAASKPQPTPVSSPKQPNPQQVASPPAPIPVARVRPLYTRGTKTIGSPPARSYRPQSVSPMEGVVAEINSLEQQILAATTNNELQNLSQRCMELSRGLPRRQDIVLSNLQQLSINLLSVAFEHLAGAASNRLAHLDATPSLAAARQAVREAKAVEANAPVQ